MFGFFRRPELPFWLLQAIDKLEYRMRIMAGELEELRAAVEANGKVADSAVSLIEGLGTRLQEALTKAQTDEDDAPIEELISELRAQSTSLANAVVANTAHAPVQQSGVVSDDPKQAGRDALAASDTSASPPPAQS